MSFLQREADRLNLALSQMPFGEMYDRLYAAQQAIVWAIDPESYKSPYNMIIGDQEEQIAHHADALAQPAHVSSE